MLYLAAVSAVRWNPPDGHLLPTPSLRREARQARSLAVARKMIALANTLITPEPDMAPQGASRILTANTDAHTQGEEPAPHPATSPTVKFGLSSTSRGVRSARCSGAASPARRARRGRTRHGDVGGSGRARPRRPSGLDEPGKADLVILDRLRASLPGAGPDAEIVRVGSRAEVKTVLVGGRAIVRAVASGTETLRKLSGAPVV